MELRKYKDNNCNKILLSYIRLSKIYFLPLQLGHYRAEKPKFWKKIFDVIFNLWSSQFQINSLENGHRSKLVGKSFFY